MLDIRHADCMEMMKEFPENHFDLAICDPPYGINVGHKVGGGKPFGKKDQTRITKSIAPKVYRGFDDTQIPSEEYFTELMRVSKNQIIWGGNYFIDYLSNTSCMLVWDKDNSGNFADCELAWTSFETAVRLFKYRWNGLLQQDMKNKEIRIHPTHKPIALYKWLLRDYAKDGDKILDTHLGSGSIAIACSQMGFDLTASEIDLHYYESALARIKLVTSQLAIKF